MEEFYFFIYNNPITAGSKQPDKLPKIMKMEKSKWPINACFSDRNKAEGPFESLQDLKQKSFILAEIKLQKHRQRILKHSNITEAKELVFTGKTDSYPIDYMSAFAHITIGKITNSKVKGVHFYNPNTIRIIEKKVVDSKTNCYSAIIEKLNQETGKWIKKESESNFFPDHWDLNKLFHEFEYAYSNRKLFGGNIYYSETTEGIKVEFIINQEDKILTCFPIIEAK